MKKGVILVSMFLIAISIMGSVSAYTVQNHHCDSMGFSTHTFYGSGGCPPDPGCLNGYKITGCGYGSSGGGIWWAEMCDANTRCCSVCGTYPSCYGKSTYYLDADGDSYGSSTTTSACSQPTGYVSNNRDCNDANAAIKPGGIEICDTVDNDCDSSIDEGDVCIKINSAYWANLIGGNITSADIADTVLMMAPGLHLDSKFINYTLYKQGAPSWNPLNWFTHTILQTSSLGVSDWKVESAGDYSFRVKVESVENNSNILGASGSTDSNPQANMTSPVQDSKFAVNYPVNFVHSSYDEDDSLKISWNFGDGYNESYYNYSMALTPLLGNTNHTYLHAGVYTVVLTAQELTRAKSSTVSARIFVFEPGINVIPIISSPNTGTSYGNWVIFNASTSFVANCTRGPMASANFVAGDLNCSYIHEPLKKTITESYDIKLNWSVYDSTGRMEQGFPRSASWKNNYSYIADYQVYFEEAKRRNAVLSMTYSS
jgi:hypothetical protein